MTGRRKKVKVKKNKKVRGIVLAFAGGCAWGISATCGQYIFAHSTIAPGALASVRLLCSGIVLLFLCFFRDRKRMSGVWRKKNDILRLILYALGGLVFIQYSYLTAIRYTDSGTATVLQYTGIILIMFLSCLKERRRPVGREILAVIFALAGIFQLATGGNPFRMSLSAAGLCWGLLAAVALAAYTLIPGNLIRRWGNLVVNGFGMTFGGIFLFVLFAVWKEERTYDGTVWLAIFGIVFVGTLLATCIYSQGVIETGPVRASLAACVEPLVATISSALWMKTVFGAVEVVGFVVIMSGVLLVSMPGTSENKRIKQRAESNNKNMDSI